MEGTARAGVQERVVPTEMVAHSPTLTGVPSLHFEETGAHRGWRPGSD